MVFKETFAKGMFDANCFCACSVMVYSAWFKMHMVHLSVFYHFLKGNDLNDFPFASLEKKLNPQEKSTLIGYNLLLWEQILSFKS